MSLLTSLLFPPKCAGCGSLLDFSSLEEDTALCKDCQLLFEGETRDRCGRCFQEVKQCLCMTELLEVQGNISKNKNMPYLDTVRRVLVDSYTVENGKKIYDGRTMSGKLVHFEYDGDAVGEFKEIKINKVGAFALFGEIIGEK